MTVNSVSSSTLSGILNNTVSRLQSQVTTLETENSTGVLADIGLTLGSDSGQDIAMHQQMADLNAITASNAVVSTQLDTSYNALTTLQSSAQTVLSAVVAGMSSTPGSTGATALAQQAAGALANFATTANSSVGGVYVFSGINSGQAPISAYSQTPTSAAQSAVQNAFQSYFGFSETSASVSTITGTQMTSFLDTTFSPLFSGANWTSNWSSASSTAMTSRVSANETTATSVTANSQAFQSMAQGLTMLSEFGGLNLSADAYSALMTSAQTTMNSASNQLTDASAEVGTMQNTVTQANSGISLQQNVLTTQINSKEDVNAYQVASQVTAISNQLQVAYSLTSQIHKLSLVNFL